MIYLTLCLFNFMIYMFNIFINFFHNIKYTMDTQFIILFVILLLGLILCTYLGGSNCVEGFAQPVGYTAPNGSIANVTTYTDQTKDITVTKTDGTITKYNTSRGDTSGRFYNPNGETATISTDLITITVTTPASGTTTTPTTTIFTGSPIIYTAADGSTATIATNTDLTKTITVTKTDKTVTKYNNTTAAPNEYKATPPTGHATINSDLTAITVTIYAFGTGAPTIIIFNAPVAPPVTPPPITPPPVAPVAPPVAPVAPVTPPVPTPTPVPPHSHDDDDDDRRHSRSYDNYNHFNGSSYASIYYGPNGSTARVVDTGNNNTLVITSKNGTTDIYYIDNNTNKKAYFGPDGSSAKLVSDSGGRTAVEVTSPTGNKINYTEENTHTYSSNIVDNFMGTMGRDSNRSAPGTSYSDIYNPVKPGTGTNASSSNTANASNPKYDADAYLASLPNGIPKSDIPFGQGDLYILKSQVVPPVCPACPPSIVKNDNTSTTSGNAAFDVSKCPPCAPCARCPEPNFDCKKVPNYSIFNPSTMPVPVLNSFSTFGV